MRLFCNCHDIGFSATVTIRGSNSRHCHMCISNVSCPYGDNNAFIEKNINEIDDYNTVHCVIPCLGVECRWLKHLEYCGSPDGLCLCAQFEWINRNSVHTTRTWRYWSWIHSTTPSVFRYLAEFAQWQYPPTSNQIRVTRHHQWLKSNTLSVQIPIDVPIN